MKVSTKRRRQILAARANAKRKRQAAAALRNTVADGDRARNTNPSAARPRDRARNTSPRGGVIRRDRGRNTNAAASEPVVRGPQLPMFLPGGFARKRTNAEDRERGYRAVVSLRLPSELLKRLDAHPRGGIGRTGLIERAIREFLHASEGATE